MTEPKRKEIARGHLKDLPLIWRFMTIPLMGVFLLASLGWAFLDLRQESIAQLETMRADIQERLQTVVGLGSRLAETYTNIYQLLLDAPTLDGEAELYRLSRPHLNELHAIEATLGRELALIETDPSLGAEVAGLIDVLGKTRIASTNALLVSTVDFGLASEQVREVTRQFNDANRRFLTVEHLLHDGLNEHIESIVSNLKQRTWEFGIIFVAGFVAAIGITIFLISNVLNAVRKSVLNVSRITRATAGKNSGPVVGNEISLLNRAINDASRSHEQLEKTSASLNASHNALRQREHTLSETNTQLSEKIEELSQVIRERDAAENALSKAQRMEAIGNLTGGVAHDFNNLLAIILGNLELLKEEEDEAEREKMFDAAVDATLRGADLTKNMLAFARRARLEPTVLKLNDIVRRTKNWAGRTLPATIVVETSLLAGLWQVEADESSTESALLNLILNARDAMPDGGQLTIETANIRIDDEYIEERAEEIEPGRYVMLAVSDTGTGIPPEELKQIFDPFFTTKPPGSGSGLGLSMIEGFTRQSGGAVRVYSEPGVGTTFKLYFRALTSVSENVAHPETQASRSVEGNTSVFVVEDEPGVLEVLVATLGKAGYSVRSATSGDEALEKFKADPEVDVLITDIVMPGKLQGTTLAKELRILRPELRVVFMSGYASEATVHGNGLRPEDIRLMKPVRSNDLLKALQKARSLPKKKG